MWNPFQYFNLPSSFLTTFLHSQFTALPYPTTSFAGQTIIITGANTGLGLEAARHFVRLGAKKVVLGVRDLEKGFAAKRDIEVSLQGHGLGSSSGDEPGDGSAVDPAIIEVWRVDVGNFTSVSAFCERISGLERVDALIENAGVATPVFELLDCGWERSVAVNVLGTFLMALLVLPKLRESAGRYGISPRLTVVASDAHEQARFKEQHAPAIFTALNAPNYQADRYNTTKLLEILIVRSLAGALTTSSSSSQDSSSNPTPKYTNPIILNTLTPGFCHSALMRHARFPLNILGWLGKRLIGRSTEVGSRTLVAAAGAGWESHGMYMTDCKVSEVSGWVRSGEGRGVQERVWGELGGVLEGIRAGVMGNI